MSTTIDIQATTTPAESQQMALERRAEQPPAPVAKQESYADLMVLAKELVGTGFLPVAIKTPAQAVAVILTGRELGLPPMQALRSICIIQGKPELAADLQLSLFKRSGGQAKWLQQTSTEAELFLKHPNGDEFTQLFTMDDARRAGLAGGVNWQKYPQAMLRSRAITAGLKSLGFEPLCGCYAPGEIGGPEVVEHHETDKPTVAAPPAPYAAAPPAPARPAPRTTTAGATPPKPAATPPKANVELPVRPIQPAIFADNATRERMITSLSECSELALEYFRKLEAPSVLLPSETLADLPLERVPVTKRQFDLLMAAISDFGNGEPASHAFPANPLPPPAKAPPKPKPTPVANAVKPPPSVEAAKKRDPEWFFDVVCPIPNKGQKRDEYLGHPDTIRSLYLAMKNGDEIAQKRLWGFAMHYQPEARTVGNKTYQPSAADHLFREALDAFCDWDKKNGRDTNADAAESHIGTGAAGASEHEPIGGWQGSNAPGPKDREPYPTRQKSEPPDPEDDVPF